MASEKMVCPHCGSMQALPKDPNVPEIDCDVCGVTMHLSASGSRYEVPDDIALDGDVPEHVKPRAATRYFKKPKATLPQHAPTGEMQMSVAGLEPAPMQPLPQPRAPGDPDKKLVAFALGMLRFRGCPCTELPGYRAFVVKVGFRHHELERKDICNVTVAATGGLLTLETIAMPLPSPPWLPLRKTLNLLNQYAGGCLFLLRECGIVVRMKVMPRTGDNGALLEVDELLQALRQLNHERNLAMMALFTASRQGHADFAGVRHAFARPLAEGKATGMIIDQLRDLSQFAGYFSVLKGNKLFLNTRETTPARCPVHFTVEHGVTKGFAELCHDGDTAWLGERMNFVRGVLRNLVQNRIPLTEPQTDRLLERMNTMNDNAALLRYIWHERKIFAMNMYTPLMRSMEVDQFRMLADALFRRAKKDSASSESGRRAV